MMDRTTTAIAAGATVSPWWLPSLADISQVAAMLLPICGVVWILVQIYFKLTERK